MIRGPRLRRALAPVMLVVLLVGLIAPAAPAQTAALDEEALYARAAPAVAVIRVRADSGSGLGTGFVIDPAGLVLTASHVVHGAERIMVEFSETVRYDARVVGYDARRDLAVLRVTPGAALPALRVAAAVRPGEPVAAIGTPRGRPRVMTTGRVLSTDDSLPGLVPEILVRFNAGVAPGNSGGPLLNAEGRVVGVVTAAFRTQDERGGLAVSGRTIQAALPGLLAGARIERAWIGIAGQLLTAGAAQRRGLGASQGVLILEVAPGSPAAAAGLRAQGPGGAAGDVIVSIEGQPVRDMEDLLRALGAREPGQRVRLGIVRGATRLDVEVTLGARP